MLHLTSDAASLIGDLITDTGADADPTAPGARQPQALRIDVRPAGSLQLSLAEQAAPEDEIVLQSGAAVYLCPEAANRLTHSTLHATGEASNRRFIVLP